jgi:hypothetical protein
MQNKFKDAVIGYVQAKAAVDQKTSEIASNFEQCFSEWFAKHGHQNMTVTEWQPCLISAYGLRQDPENIECKSCKAAHLAIQERKQLRQKLGRAKSWITKLGKSEIKQQKKVNDHGISK